MSRSITLRACLVPLFTVTAFCASSQETASGQAAADTVIVPLAAQSKIVLTVGDPADLDVLRHYNFQALFDDIVRRLRESHGLETEANAAEIDRKQLSEWEPAVSDSGDVQEDDGGDDSDDGDEEDHKWDKSRRGKVGQTWQSYNIDIGTNNYLAGDQFPDGSEPYAVRPWGSWYLGVNSVQRTRLARNLFVEWGMGVSWYSFKFQEDNTRVLKEELGVSFAADSRDVDFIKSKLSATFINASLVPVLDFGDHSRKHRIWDRHGDGFRLGVGPYVGYRISSKSKLVYEAEGDREKEKNRDNFYLNNLRYGLRLQLGVRSTDLFVNYDMNELFAEGKGPALNAISFGLIF